MDRRDFLRFAGMGLTLPAAGGLLSACGGDDTSTASASASPTTAGADAASSTAPGTTVKKEIRKVKIGFIALTDCASVIMAKELGYFAERSLDKTYLAIVCGEMPHPTGEIRAAIARHPSHRKRMAVTEDSGRDAWTSYRVIERLKHATFVQATLHTGRTHQIRVHFQHIGFPLVGDETYGARQNQRLDRDGDSVRRARSSEATIAMTATSASGAMTGATHSR